jgi:hypothetical protein
MSLNLRVRKLSNLVHADRQIRRFPHELECACTQIMQFGACGLSNELALLFNLWLCAQ